MLDKRGMGGDGLLINGKPFLLDPVEAGVQDRPRYRSEVPMQPKILAVIERALTYSFELYDLRLISST